jgi:hypothetical protein
MFVRLGWLLMRMLMGVSVIHVVLLSPPLSRTSSVFHVEIVHV